MKARMNDQIYGWLIEKFNFFYAWMNERLLNVWIYYSNYELMNEIKNEWMIYESVHEWLNAWIK